MDVFLVPVGVDRYEPYCEVTDEVPDEAVTNRTGRPTSGWWSRVVQRFRTILAAAESERRRRREPHEDAGPVPARTRLKRRLLRWIAEHIAEQRLLWHLGRQTDVALVHPDDLEAEAALGIVRTALERDRSRHWRWLIVDLVLFAASGVLMLLPGPNIVAYYFAFRVVGHWLCVRGARQGLLGVTWQARGSHDLTELRREITHDRAERRERVRTLAARLRLEHLPTFFDRMTLGSA